jgi:hypothetical protein
VGSRKRSAHTSSSGDSAVQQPNTRLSNAVRRVIHYCAACICCDKQGGACCPVIQVASQATRAQLPPLLSPCCTPLCAWTLPNVFLRESWIEQKSGKRPDFAFKKNTHKTGKPGRKQRSAPACWPSHYDVGFI